MRVHFDRQRFILLFSKNTVLIIHSNNVLEVL